MKLTDERLRHIVKEELLYRHALDEGIWDDAKQRTAKPIKAVTKRTDSTDVTGK